MSDSGETNQARDARLCSSQITLANPVALAAVEVQLKLVGAIDGQRSAKHPKWVLASAGWFMRTMTGAICDQVGPAMMLPRSYALSF